MPGPKGAVRLSARLRCRITPMSSNILGSTEQSDVGDSGDIIPIYH